MNTNIFFQLTRLGVSLVLLLTGTRAVASAGQATFRVVAYLTGRFSQPIGVTEGSPGVFYSVAGSGGVGAFSVTTAGSKTFLTGFQPGYNLVSTLVGASNGRFFSALELGANLNVFSVDSDQGRQVYPTQNILPTLTYNLPDGTLLGVGISLAGPWYLAKTDIGGNVTPIYQFPSGERPPNVAIYATDGNYYGVSTLPDASGYVYRVNPAGSLTKLASFPSKSFALPVTFVPLLQATDGNLYGATTAGGANGKGGIFTLTLGGKYTLLYSFPAGPNSTPQALIEGSDGNLYGATAGFGFGNSLLFRVTRSGQYTTMYAMDNLARDGDCICLLTLGSDGIIYGTASGGGVTGAGDIFALDVGAPKPAPRAQHFHPQSGPAGTQVSIWGYNLLGASVQFNGVAAAKVANSGGNYVWAEVPTGATTGPIMVTTPGGTITTQASFTVE